MTILRPVIFLFLLLNFPFLHAETLTGRVVRVTDGDTIVVLDADKVQHKIRLQGIDAPERRQAFGTKSKEHLSDLVAGKTVEVDYSKYDRYLLLDVPRLSGMPSSVNDEPGTLRSYDITSS